MRSAVDTIQRVLASKLLVPELVCVPDSPLLETQIVQSEQELGLAFSAAYRRLLLRWNGIDLDVVRIAGVRPLATASIPVVRRLPAPPHGGGLDSPVAVVATDPAGFTYLEARDGSILSMDGDGGSYVVVALGFDEFVSSYVFGEHAESFGGREWIHELQAAGLLPSPSA